MPPKRKSNQIQPEVSFDQIPHNDYDSVEKAVSPQEIPVEQPPKKKTRKPRTTKKKDLSLQEGSDIIDLSTSPVIKAEEVIPIKKRPGRKPKVKQEIVEEPHEQQQQQNTQHQLLFINATPEGPVKRKPGRKPKAKKQEEQQNQQQPILEEKIIQSTPASSSPAAIRNLINLDDAPPYGFNKSEVKSESQNNNDNNSSITPSPIVQPPITPIPTSIATSISTVTPPATSKRGRPKKVKVDSQAIDAVTSDVTESHDAKPAPTRKRKPRKQEVSAEIDKPPEIISGETPAFREQVSLQQQQKQEEVEQPAISAKAVNPTKKRRTKKQDAVATTQSTTSVEQTPVQNEKQPLVKTTKRGRPKKIKLNDTMSEKPEETVSVKMEKESDVVELDHKSSTNADLQIPSIAKVEYQKLVDSVGPKNSSVVLNEKAEMSEYQDRKKLSVRSTDNFDNFQSSVTQLQKQDNTTENVRDKEKIVNSTACEQNVNRKCSSDTNDNDNEDSDQPIPKKLSRIEEHKAKMEMFKKLRRRMDEGESANRKEVYEEHQRKKTNPKEIIRQERKREEAEKLLAKQQAEERGEDHERSKFWEYSAESVEKWEKKQEKKAKKSDVAFTDYNQVAHKKYKKQINELKPDLATYNEQKAAAIASSSLITTEDGQVVSVDTESAFYRDANSLQYASVDNQPSSEAIDKVVADVNKTIAKREKSSRQKTINEDDDITYINERNRKFNEKIGRFYDKYTKEIKENFERGTAL